MLQIFVKDIGTWKSTVDEKKDFDQKIVQGA